ncbi:MAG TPA: TonB-dependent receptor, partial [Oceanipulchritudo sp.]|nr:TonB-dependent receptor [Oceanipulchritudo sp.]
AVVRDELIRSTSLTQGDFSERDYGEASLLLRRAWHTRWGEWAVYGGAGIDTSDEDSTVGLPQVGVSASGVSDALTWQAYVEYAKTSQVPGYTVLKSSPTGLFGGNELLGRETADTVEAGLLLQRGPVSGKVVVFQRNDEDLVDWVYDSTSPNARRAAAVDIEVQGIESWLRWEGGSTALEAGYAWLGKDADYGNESVDASFYALNYARHRLLLSIEQRLTKQVFARVEGEYRKHPNNALRTSGDEALLLNLAVSWTAIFGPGWDLVLRGYNLTKEDFQSIPGAAAPGREGNATLSYAW